MHKHRKAGKTADFSDFCPFFGWRRVDSSLGRGFESELGIAGVMETRQ